MEDTYTYLLAKTVNDMPKCVLNYINTHKEDICELYLYEMGYNVKLWSGSYCELVSEILNIIKNRSGTSDKIFFNEPNKILNYMKLKKISVKKKVIKFLKKHVNKSMKIIKIGGNPNPNDKLIRVFPFYIAPKSTKMASKILLNDFDYRNTYRERGVNPFSFIPTDIIDNFYNKIKEKETIKELEQAQINENILNIGDIIEMLENRIKQLDKNLFFKYAEGYKLLLEAFRNTLSKKRQKEVVLKQKYRITPDNYQQERYYIKLPAISDFIAPPNNRNNEISIKDKPMVRIYNIYSDGSLYGQNLVTDSEGYFPITVFI